MKDVKCELILRLAVLTLMMRMLQTFVESRGSKRISKRKTEQWQSQQNHIKSKSGLYRRCMEHQFGEPMPQARILI